MQPWVTREISPALCGGDLMRSGLRSVSGTLDLQLSHAALAHGYAPRREQIARKLEAMEIASTPTQILTTPGSTQAIDLVVRHFLRAGDTVVVGDPAGTLLTAAVAYQMLRIAEAHDMVVVEDDIYADFVPSGVQSARLASLDQLKRVVYIGSFSKTLVPSIRVGYVAASAEVAEAVAGLKLLTSSATPEINERIVYQALTQGSYRKHCPRVHTALDRLREPVFKRYESMGLTPFCRPQAGFLGWFDTGALIRQPWPPWAWRRVTCWPRVRSFHLSKPPATGCASTLPPAKTPRC